MNGSQTPSTSTAVKQNYGHNPIHMCQSGNQIQPRVIVEPNVTDNILYQPLAAAQQYSSQTSLEFNGDNKQTSCLKCSPSCCNRFEEVQHSDKETSPSSVVYLNTDGSTDASYEIAIHGLHDSVEYHLNTGDSSFLNHHLKGADKIFVVSEHIENCENTEPIGQAEDVLNIQEETVVSTASDQIYLKKVDLICPHICGTCQAQFDTVCRLHKHIQCQHMAASYSYCFATKIAFLRFESVCKDTQTDLADLVESDQAQFKYDKAEDLNDIEDDLDERFDIVEGMKKKKLTAVPENKIGKQACEKYETCSIKSREIEQGMSEKFNTSLKDEVRAFTEGVSTEENEKVLNSNVISKSSQIYAASKSKLDTILNNTLPDVVAQNRRKWVKQKEKTTENEQVSLASYKNSAKQVKKVFATGAGRDMRRARSKAKKSENMCIDINNSRNISDSGRDQIVEMVQQTLSYDCPNTIEESKDDKVKTREKSNQVTQSNISMKGEIKCLQVKNGNKKENSKTDSCTNGDNFSCRICATIYKSKLKLTNHIKKIHYQDGQGDGDSEIQCKWCDQTFPGTQSFSAHKRQCSKNENLLCFICYERFETKHQVADHLLTHRNLDELKCQCCCRKFNDAVSLNKHMRRHNWSKNMQCEYCGKAFYNSALLKKHYYHCNKEPDIDCPKCDLKFKTQPLLKRHMTTHSTDRPFVCHICGFAVKRATYLQRHIRCHTGERPFKCKECGMAFRTATGINRHRKKHTNYKPCVCGFCGKSFANNWNLKIHLRQHTGDTPYSCEQCGKSFKQNVLLKLHRKSHQTLC